MGAPVGSHDLAHHSISSRGLGAFLHTATASLASPSLYSWMARTHKELHLSLLSKTGSRMIHGQDKNQTLEAVALPAPWFKDDTIVPIPFKHVHWEDVSIFTFAIVGKHKPSRAGEIQLCQGI